MKKIMVVAAVVMDGDRVLASSRPTGKSLAGYWEFPGGKVEAGESLTQALRRELLEELNLTVRVFDPVYYLEDRNAERVLILHFLRCHALNPERLEAREQQQWRWVARAELSALHWLPLDRPLVEFLQNIQ